MTSKGQSGTKRTQASRMQTPQTISTDKPLAKSYQLCTDHSQQVFFCCFDCQDNLCCARCISSGKHQNHDVKNLQRSYVIVEASLNELLIRLGATIDLYSLSHEKLSILKSQVIQDFMEARNQIQQQFQTARQHLERKRLEISQALQAQSATKQQEIAETLQNIRKKMKECMDFKTGVEHSLRQLSQAALCKYYTQSVPDAQQLLKQPSYEARHQRPQLSIQSDRFRPILQAIKQLKMPCVFVYPMKKQEIARVSIGFDRCLTNVRETYLSSSPIVMTPKNPSSEKRLNINVFKQSFKMVQQSRKNLKMFSMPSSPPKEKKESPLHYLEMQKKSFIMAKKNS